MLTSPRKVLETLRITRKQSAHQMDRISERKVFSQIKPIHLARWWHRKPFLRSQAPTHHYEQIESGNFHEQRKSFSISSWREEKLFIIYAHMQFLSPPHGLFSKTDGYSENRFPASAFAFLKIISGFLVHESILKKKQKNDELSNKYLWRYVGEGWGRKSIECGKVITS